MTDAATVITPYSWGSRAIELGSRTWSKRVLPVGNVQYKGRTLRFTPDYISGLVEAWHDRAYDQVPLQLADHANQHTNDPERTRGWITAMEARDDGLWVTAELTPAGEAVISENPMLGVSCRIVENYDRSDGRHYPAAVQHVLGTLDPRIPQLGSWQPTDLSNGGELIIDLSGGSWWGEPGPSLELAASAVASRLGALTPAEQAELDQVLAEVEAEMLPAGYGGQDYSGLAEYSETFDRNYAAEAARDQARAEAGLRNLISPPRNDEEIVARALAELEDEIYDTSRVAAMASPSREAIELSTELTMATGEGICGSPDPFGRCSSRYHDLQCRHAVSTDWQAIGASRSTYEAALSNFAGAHDLGPSPATYGDGEDSHPIPPNVMEFAHALNQSWGLAVPDTLTADDLFGPSWAGDPYAAMAGEVGRPDLAGPQPSVRDYPDVSAIRAGLGI